MIQLHLLSGQGLIVNGHQAIDAAPGTIFEYVVTQCQRQTVDPVRKITAVEILGQTFTIEINHACAEGISRDHHMRKTSRRGSQRRLKSGATDRIGTRGPDARRVLRGGGARISPAVPQCEIGFLAAVRQRDDAGRSRAVFPGPEQSRLRA